MKKSFLGFLLVAVVFAVLVPALATNRVEAQKKKKAKLEEKSSPAANETRNLAYLVKEVRKELVTIPNFGVYDWLEGNVEPDGTVFLRGEVIRPTTKSEAEHRVKKIEGVEKVVNQIEVLPLSSSDDQLRRAVFRALFNSGSPLFRYGRQAIPPIHIIIKNGRLTLKGIVATKTDSNVANLKASGVSGLFEVRNELQVESSGKKK